MDRLIYTAASGMNASMVQQRMIASNMANAQTIGFRAEVLARTPVTLDGPSLEVRSMNQAEVRGALMNEGSFIQTGRELDIAMQGKTLLTVQAQDGTEAYTRRGDLTVSATGVLENGDHLPVMSEDGPITVPIGARVTISPDGGVMVSDPQSPDQPPAELTRLKLASYNGTAIEKDLTGLFRVPGGGILPADVDAKVTPGTLEQSNVNPSEVLVQMVEAQRLFDIRSNLISTARERDEGSASLMRLNT